MAQFIGGSINTKFIDRGYIYQPPTLSECNDMGWTIIQAYKYARNENLSVSTATVGNMKIWCKENLWWQDYVWSYSDVAFKRPANATMFRLRWA